MDSTHVTAPDVTDYAGLARRHWWVLAVMLLAGLAGGTALVRTAERVYQSTTSVLVQPTGVVDTNVSGGRTRGEINLDTEAQLMQSHQVATEAAALLRLPAPPDRFTRNLRVEVPPNTSVLQVRYLARTPEEARAGSHAFAEAYLHYRGKTAEGEVATQMAALGAKLKQFSGELVTVNRRLDVLVERSAERSTLQSQRATLISQINTLTGRINTLATITVTPGKIITDADLPTRPVKPQVPLYLGGGATIGALVGVVVALARERFGRRVRTGAEVSRRDDVPVLAQLGPDATPYSGDLCAPHTAAGRTFHRLRNEVMASLRPEDHVLVVTGATRGAGATVVAANLAAAIARAGNEVILVGAHAPELRTDAVPLSRLLQVADAPGLTDVLAGGAHLSAAIQQAARTPRLRVLTVGGTASAAGLLQSEGVRAALAALSQKTDYVVVEAPSMAAGPDAQSLAGVAHAAIMVVETRRTRHAEIVDAAEQLRRVGTPLLGAVVLPRATAPLPSSATPVIQSPVTRALTAGEPVTEVVSEMDTPPPGIVVEAIIVDEDPAPARGADSARRPAPMSRPSSVRGNGAPVLDEATEVLTCLDPKTLAAMDGTRTDRAGGTAGSAVEAPADTGSPSGGR